MNKMKRLSAMRTQLANLSLSPNKMCAQIETKWQRQCIFVVVYVFRTKGPQSLVATSASFYEPSLPNLSPTTSFSEMIQQIIAFKVDRISYGEKRPSYVKAAEKPLMDKSQTGDASTTDEVRTTSFHFVECAITTMACKNAFNDLFTWNLDR